MQLSENTPSHAATQGAAATPKLVIGPILGCCALPEHVVKHAAALAQEFYKAQEEIEWSGESVETYSEPLWLLRDGATWRPDMAPFGLRRLTGSKGWERFSTTSQLVVTAGVDQHEDHAHGLVLMIVLHNDGLKFKQGRVSHAPKAGDWFIFDDRKKHGVSSGKDGATFVGWSLPVESIPD